LFKTNSNVSKFGLSEKHITMLRKIKIKYGFKDLEEVNNFLHIIFLRFGMNIELKFMEFSRLEFDRI
jgi:hypothetical protein